MNTYSTMIDYEQLALREEWMNEMNYFNDEYDFDDEIGGFVANPKRSKEQSKEVKSKNNKIDRSKLREQKRSYEDD